MVLPVTSQPCRRLVVTSNPSEIVRGLLPRTDILSAPTIENHTERKGLTYDGVLLIVAYQVGTLVGEC